VAGPEWVAAACASGLFPGAAGMSCPGWAPDAAAVSCPAGDAEALEAEALEAGGCS